MNPDQPGRRKTHKRVWFALLAILFVTALLVVPPLVSIARYKNRITQLVSASLRRPVRLSSVELRILPRPGFVLTDLTVDEDPGYGAEPILHANTVTTAVRLSSLWRGQLQLSRISVDEASLNLVRTPDGRWNADSLFRNAAVLPSGNGRRSVPYPYLEATNSRINVKDGVEKLPFSLVNADASLWQEDGAWRVRLRGQPARTDVVLDLNDTGIVRLDGTLHPGPQPQQMPIHLDLDWQEAQLGQLSRLLLGSDEGWRGNLTGEFHLDGTAALAQIKSRLRATGVHRAEFAPAVPIDFDANCAFAYRSNTRAVENLVCDSPLGDGHLRLSGTVPGVLQSNPAPPPHMALELERIPAQAALDMLRTLRPNVAPGLQAGGTISGKVAYAPPAADPPPNGPAGPRHPAPGPLSGSFTLEGLSLTGDSLTAPIHAAKVTFEPVERAAGQAPALQTTFPLPAGGPGPLNVSASLALHGFEVAVRGPVSLARLRELARIAGIPQANAFEGLTGEPAVLDVTAQGPWLPQIYPELAAGPGAPTPVIPVDSGNAAGSMSGTIALRDGTWKPAFLADAVTYRSALLHFENGGMRWDPVNFAYGPIEGSATVVLPGACASVQECAPHFELHFDSLDAGEVQSAVLGAKGNSTLLSSLIARFKPDAASPWPSAEGQVYAQRFIVGPFVLTDVSTGIKLQPTGAGIPSFSGGVFGGQLQASGSLTVGESPAYKLQGAVSGADPAAIGPLVGMKWSGRGLDISGKVELSGFTDTALAHSAAGKLHFDWSHGGMASLTNAPVPPALARFDRFSGDATLASGMLTLADNQVERGAKKDSVTGSIEFGSPARVTLGRHTHP